MSIHSAPVDLRLPADPTATEPGTKVIAVLRRLVGGPRWSQERPNLNIGHSYRIPDRRQGPDSGSNWIHTHR